MLQLDNLTPFAASMALFPDENGIDTLFIMVKGGFNIGEKWTLVDQQRKPVEADIYWDEADNSSLRYASDYHIGKPFSDIVMNGLACSVKKQPVTQMNVSLHVGRVDKTIKIFGDRYWQDGRITDPEPFQTMPVIYEKAFGGVYSEHGEIQSSESRNPLGCGYSGARSALQMNGQALPNLEDPENLISDPNDEPEPACFGFVCPAWQPRSGYAGTYDDNWQQSRAPYLPVDFDTRFLNMAHPDLIYPGYLQGGEDISITGMHPAGTLHFTLPEISLATEVLIEGKVAHPDLKLETLILEPNQLQLSMVWKASIRCDREILKISSIKVLQKAVRHNV